MSKLRWRNLICFSLMALLTPGCQAKSSAPASAPSAAAAVTNRQYYQAKGVVKELDVTARGMVIQHEAVPGYMPAMTMPFEVRNPNEMRGLQAGDTVSFRIVIAGSDAWIDQITNLLLPRVAGTVVPPGWQVTRELDPGDPLPNYHLTNELGQAISTSQFKGSALAFTFIFTRCPYPRYCPLMSSNFSEARKKLLAMTNGPTNWHLLSISFDPAYDTPATLKDYAARYESDPQHWNFATSDLTTIKTFGGQVGETFRYDSGILVHSLATVVVDTRGRVQVIMPGSEWTVDELVAEIVRAAKVKP